jgi:hypothetical protein
MRRLAVDDGGAPPPFRPRCQFTLEGRHQTDSVDNDDGGGGGAGAAASSRDDDGGERCPVRRRMRRTAAGHAAGLPVSTLRHIGVLQRLSVREGIGVLPAERIERVHPNGMGTSLLRWQ